jgi:hypothetical protein
MEKALPGEENFFLFGLATVCWAIYGKHKGIKLVSIIN